MLSSPGLENKLEEKAYDILRGTILWPPRKFKRGQEFVSINLRHRLRSLLLHRRVTN